MAGKQIGILYPGQMGVSIAAAAQHGGNEVYWVSEGRSQATRQRAAKVSLQDAGTLADLCRRCELILSVCPPHIAEDVASAGDCAGLFRDSMSTVTPSRRSASSASARHGCRRGALCGRGDHWRAGVEAGHHLALSVGRGRRGGSGLL